MTTSLRGQHERKFDIHEDVAYTEDTDMQTDVDQVDEETIALQQPRQFTQQDSHDEETSDDESIDDGVLKEMERLQKSFAGFRNKYRLVKRIGEGTFSTVYKAEDLQYDRYDNGWDVDKENDRWTPQKPKRLHSTTSTGTLSRSSTMAESTDNRPRRKPKFVAIKKIYVTSSPLRILNELDLLHDLRNCTYVCPLITAFRNTDQVVAILPYFRHQDFREYFRDMTIPDMAIYLRCLLLALSDVHKRNILHRDIKPTNFLYDKPTRRGVLVDFGLAEREGVDFKPCLCHDEVDVRKTRIRASVGFRNGHQQGFPKNDTRNARRANRAGTRGFRAPEVLFKCTEQSTKIDIWSVGVILLIIMSRRFPFFNSADDVDAMLEIATMFGANKMKAAAHLHGVVFQSEIPTMGSAGYDLGKIVHWCLGLRDTRFTSEEEVALDFLKRLLELDPAKRLSADEALAHDFMKLGLEQEDGRDIDEALGALDEDDEVDILR